MLKAIKKAIVLCVFSISFVVGIAWMSVPRKVGDQSEFLIHPDYVHHLDDRGVKVLISRPLDIDIYLDSQERADVSDKDTTTYLRDEDYTSLGWCIIERGDKLSFYGYEGKAEYLMAVWFSEVLISKTGKGSQPSILFKGIPKSRGELSTIMRQVGIIQIQTQ